MTGTVPEFWELPTSAAPLRARAVGWLMAVPALLVLPLAPRRVGPHVSRSGWGLTVLAHVICAVIALLLATFADSLVYDPFQGALRFTSGPTIEFPEMQVTPITYTWFDSTRWFLTTAINMLFVRTQARGDAYGVIGGLIGFHAGAWLIGLTLMPFLAAGERSRLLYLRCVKLVLWSTACVLPLALTMLAVVCLGVRYYQQFYDVPWETAVAGAVAVWLLWWLSVLLRLGARYAAPPQGPSWQPRRPRCTGCGYVLTGLPVSGRCPECALAVHASLPEARKPSPWDAATRVGEKPRAYLHTVWQVLRGRKFFRALAVYGSSGAGVSFAIWTVLLAGILCPVATILAVGLHGASSLEKLTNGALHFAIATAAAVVVFSGGLVVVALWACRLGRRDPRPTTAAVCYGAALFWPTIGTLWLSAIGLLLAVDAGWLRGGFTIPVLGWVDHGMLCGLGLAVPVVAAFTWALVRMRRALRDVQHAAA